MYTHVKQYITSGGPQNPSEDFYFKEEQAVKRFLSVLLSLVLAINICGTALAAESEPSEGYDPNPMHGYGAWSYIKIVPVSGAASDTHYIYSNYRASSTSDVGRVDFVKGFSYKAKSNSLTMKNYSNNDTTLIIHNMGTGFRLKLAGKNILRSIVVEQDGWDSALTIDGNGTATLGNKSDHDRIPLNVSGNLTILSGTIKCIKEDVDVTAAGHGERNSVFVSSKSSTPIRTELKHKGTLTFDKEHEAVYSDKTVTFSGKALKAPTLKRKGRIVKWKSVSGAKYQVKVGNTIKTLKKASYSGKTKVSVRIVKSKNGIMVMSPWSKRT